MLITSSAPKKSPFRPGQGNVQPAGHIRPAKHLNVARGLRLKFYK